MKPDVSLDLGEEREVATATDVFSLVELTADLANENSAG
jgi:hypothetical protein